MSQLSYQNSIVKSKNLKGGINNTMLKKMGSFLEKWKAYKASLKDRNKLAWFVVDNGEALLVALVMALVIRQFLLQSSKVVSGSMIPTLKINDRLIVSKVNYRFVEPHRGEVVLFNSPDDDRKEYVKRLVGLPGETIEVRRGVIFINDKQITFPGVNILQDYSEMPPVKIPAGHYFMMGDNRSNSSDSRYWGFVNRDDLIGKALFTFWPPQHIQIIH